MGRNTKITMALAGAALVSLLATRTAVAQDMETVVVSQNVGTETSEDGSSATPSFYPGMGCAHLADFSDEDFATLDPIKQKGLLLNFCATEPLYACADYEAYLPNGYKLEPQGHGNLCRLIISRKKAN